MATPEAFDFNVVLRPFKSHTWKAPSRRHKPTKAILADEQRRLQAITAHHIQRQEQAREQLEALELKENPDEETVKEIEKDKRSFRNRRHRFHHIFLWKRRRLFDPVSGGATLRVLKGNTSRHATGYGTIIQKSLL